MIKEAGKMSTLKRKLSIFTIAALMAVLCAVISFGVPSAVYAEDNTIKYNDVSTLEQLRELPPDLIATWTKYDSRKYDIVTSVKDQGYRNICWSYASIAAMETSILRKGLFDADKNTLNLDEVELAKAVRGKWDDPLNLADDGRYNKRDEKWVMELWNSEGSVSDVANFCMRWQGVFDETVSTNAPSNAYSKYRLQSVASCDNVVDDIKYLIAAYGGVAFSYKSNDYKTYYIAEPGYDHASLIVGWDDSIAASNFGTTSKGASATQNGGWIVKNSYGSGLFEGGYQYLSYDSVLYEITAFEVLDNEDYDWCYQYSKREPEKLDVLSVNSEQYVYAASYQAAKGHNPVDPYGPAEDQIEHLKGVTVGVMGRKATVNVSIYKSSSVSRSNPIAGEKVASVSFVTPDTKMGNYDIELDEPVPFNFGEYFTIYVEIEGGNILRRMSDLSDNIFIGQRDDENPEQISWGLLSMDAPFFQSNLTIMGLTVVQELDERPSIAECDISLSQDVFTFNGNIHKPDVTVTDTEGNVVDASNYTVNYGNNYNVGNPTVEVRGKGEYKGKLFATYTIEPLAFQKGDPDLIVNINEAYYDGRAKTPDAVIIWNGFTLKAGKDYTIRYSNNIEVCDDALARITFQGRFSGLIEQTFVIHKGYLTNLPVDITTETGDVGVLSEITPIEGWEWVEPNTQLKVGTNRVKIRYYDYKNYENGEMEIIVTRLKFQKLNDLYAYDLNSLNGTDTDFESLKAIKAILASFTDDDRRALGNSDTAKVQSYQARIDSWDALVEGLDAILGVVNK